MDIEYVEVSLGELCVLYLEQAAHEAERATADPRRWFFALPEMHRALGCALVAALRGPQEFGAYAAKDQRQWQAYYNHPNYPDREPPDADYLQDVSSLLKRVQSADEPGMWRRPVVLTEGHQSDLKTLNTIRNDMQHVKPGAWVVLIPGLPRLLAAAAEVIDQLLKEPRCWTDVEPENEDRAAAAIARIRSLAVGSTPRPPE